MDTTEPQQHQVQVDPPVEGPVSLPPPSSMKQQPSDEQPLVDIDASNLENQSLVEVTLGATSSGDTNGEGDGSDACESDLPTVGHRNNSGNGGDTPTSATTSADKPVTSTSPPLTVGTPIASGPVLSSNNNNQTDALSNSQSVVESASSTSELKSKESEESNQQHLTIPLVEDKKEPVPSDLAAISLSPTPTAKSTHTQQTVNTDPIVISSSSTTTLTATNPTVSESSLHPLEQCPQKPKASEFSQPSEPSVICNSSVLPPLSQLSEDTATSASGDDSAETAGESVASVISIDLQQAGQPKQQASVMSIDTQQEHHPKQQVVEESAIGPGGNEDAKENTVETKSETEADIQSSEQVSIETNSTKQVGKPLQSSSIIIEIETTAPSSSPISSSTPLNSQTVLEIQQASVPSSFDSDREQSINTSKQSENSTSPSEELDVKSKVIVEMERSCEQQQPDSMDIDSEKEPAQQSVKLDAMETTSASTVSQKISDFDKVQSEVMNMCESATKAASEEELNSKKVEDSEPELSPMEIEKESSEFQGIASSDGTDSASSLPTDSSPSKKRPSTTPSPEDKTEPKRQKVENLIDEKLPDKQQCAATTNELDSTGDEANASKPTTCMEATDAKQKSTDQQMNTKVETSSGVDGAAPSALRSMAVRTSSTGIVGLPMLRSSPVRGIRSAPAENNNSGGKSTPSPSSGGIENNASATSAGAARQSSEKKKRKAVSWATDDKLTETHFIDTRIELVKTWDPQFLRITLPFSPGTFHMFHQAIVKNSEDSGITEQDNAFLPPSTADSEAADGEDVNNNDKTSSVPGVESDSSGGISGTLAMSAFEDSRKKEHDMEQVRAKQASEELKNRLSGMSAKRRWSSPRSVVLPAECEIEDKNIENFNIVDDRYIHIVGNDAFNNNNEKTVPGSPPLNWRWTDEGEASDMQVRWFPLSDENPGEEEGEQGGGDQQQQERVEWGGQSESGDAYNRSERSYRGGMSGNGGMPHGGGRGGLGLGLRSVAVPGMSGGNSGNHGRSQDSGGGLRGNNNNSGNDIGVGTENGNLGAGGMGGLRGERGRMLPPNVRQLLSALQTSGVLRMNNRGGGSGDGGDQVAHMGGGGGNGNGGIDGQEGYAGGNRGDMMGMGGVATVGGGNEEDGYGGMDVGNGAGMNGPGHMGEMNGRMNNGMANGNVGNGPGTGGMMEGFPFGMGAVPPVPPGALGLGPNLMQMGAMGLPMGPMGMPMMPQMGIGGPGAGLGLNGNGNGNGGGDNNNGDSLGLLGGSNKSNRSNSNSNNNSNSNSNSNRGGGGGGGLLSRGARAGRQVETITRPKSKVSKQRKKCKYFGSKQGCRDGANSSVNASAQKSPSKGNVIYASVREATPLQKHQQKNIVKDNHQSSSFNNSIKICGPSATRSRHDWTNEAIPEICNKIQAFPQPLRKNCSTADPIPGVPKCDPAKPMMFGQYGEDYFLYTRHFVHMDKPGVYLDVAAHNPVSISNTYFMDRCLGWSGICVEANSRYFEPLHRQRSCALVPTCVSAIEGESVEFVLSGPGSGIVSTHRQGANIFNDEKKTVEKKKCVTVRSQLERYGVTDIDYFNLDVEGGELNTLKSIDWDKTRIKVISVEISLTSEKPIYEFLTGKGFIKIDTMATVNGIPGMPIYPANRFYVHSSGKFGQPW